MVVAAADVHSRPITVAALVLYGSMGDFERFGKSCLVSSYYGLAPKHRYGGEKSEANGRAAKAGDSLCHSAGVFNGGCPERQGPLTMGG